MLRTSLSSSVTWTHNSAAVLTRVFSRKVVNAGGELSDDNNDWNLVEHSLAPKCWFACLQTQLGKERVQACSR